MKAVFAGPPPPFKSHEARASRELPDLVRSLPVGWHSKGSDMELETANPEPGSDSRPFLRALGSLWLAAVLLVLLLVAMACATVFEAQHGTERALATFYKSSWFQVALALLALSIVATLALHFPFVKHQFGFVLTHGAILLILAGALITREWGVDGQVGIAEGQTVSEFGVRQDSLTITRRSMPNRAVPTPEDRAEVDLPGPVFGGFEPVEDLQGPELSWGDVRIAVKGYLPNRTRQRRIVDDNPRLYPAVEVAWTGAESGEPIWVFADQKAELDSTSIAFRMVQSSDEWARLMAGEGLEQTATDGTVKIEYEGASFDVPLANCLQKTVPLGDTGLTVRVLRYLPHAVVGPDNKTTSASDQPVNPAIEVEVVGPAGKEKRFAFSKFPDFRHGADLIKGLKLTFVAPTAGSSAPVEVLSNTDGDLYVRFSREGAPVQTRKLQLAEPVESPWRERSFVVLQHFEHARVDWQFVAADPEAKDREPAILVEVSAGEDTQQLWLQKYSPGRQTLDGATYELVYGDKRIPLGFGVRLDRFRLGYYPGTRRPRSFESQITIKDPTAGGEQSRIVSMNHPTQYGGYTFYQSSYRQGNGPTVTFLSVARDPGQAVVFAGYILMLLGMLVVLGTRISERRQVAQLRKRSLSIRRPKRETRRQELVHS